MKNSSGKRSHFRLQNDNDLLEFEGLVLSEADFRRGQWLGRIGIYRATDGRIIGEFVRILRDEVSGVASVKKAASFGSLEDAWSWIEATMKGPEVAEQLTTLIRRMLALEAVAGHA